MNNLKQKGFTLVEIAIVLVIVGLLIGGVLKGQEMITNAKLKRIESDNAGFTAAMFSYQDRYMQLPGDDSGAEDRFDVYTTDDVNGGGNGVVGDGTDWDDVIVFGSWLAGDTQETSKFFGHLRAAGLIPGGSGEDPTRPSNAYGGLIGIQNGAVEIAGHVTIFGQIEGAIARILEGRLDDGLIAKGRIRGNEVGASMDADTDVTAVPNYTEDKRYNLAFRL